MKKLLLIPMLALSGCATYTTPDGRTQTALTPAGSGILQTVLSSGLGVASGALMNGAPSWATGGVGGAVGSIGSQVISALTQGAQGAQVIQTAQPYGAVTPQPTGYGRPYYPQQGGGAYYRTSYGTPQPQYPPQEAYYPYTY